MDAKLAGFRHCRVQAGEVGMHVVIGGKGPPLVLICSATALMAGPRQQDGRSLRGATMA